MGVAPKKPEWENPKWQPENDFDGRLIVKFNMTTSFLVYIA